MTPEYLTAIGSIGTFVVIAATAVAAVIQLRHMRANNQLTGLLNVLARIEDPESSGWYEDAKDQIAKNMGDPNYRRAIYEGTFSRRDNAWANLCNSYEWTGSLVKHDLIPEEPFMDVYSARLQAAWDLVEEIVAIRRRRGDPSLWENFEYLVVRAKAWEKAYPSGAYPADAERLKIADKWLAADSEWSKTL